MGSQPLTTMFSEAQDPMVVGVEVSPAMVLNSWALIVGAVVVTRASAVLRRVNVSR